MKVFHRIEELLDNNRALCTDVDGNDFVWNYEGNETEFLEALEYQKQREEAALK